MRAFMRLVEALTEAPPDVGAADRKVWHVTPRRNLSRIMREGLLPRIGARSRALGESRKAVYVFSEWASVEDALMNWLGDQFEDVSTSLLELAVPAAWIGPSTAAFEAVLVRPVPPERIRLLVADMDDWDGSYPGQSPAG